MIVKRIISALFVATLGWASFSAAALAVDASATTALNVRSGPGTEFGVVDTLASGESVSIVECSGSWCYVSQQDGGPSGWVSSSYLTTAADEPEPEDPDCSLGLTFGPGGPSLSITCGDGAAPAPLPVPDPVSPRACLYKNDNFGGVGVCYGPGTVNSLGAAINDKTSSIKLLDGARVKVCVNNNLGGLCRTINNDRATLGPLINDRISSIVVYTGAPPAPPAPVTHSTGPIDLPQTWTANLDNGAVGGSGADIWFRAVNAVSKFLEVRNGAQFALGDATNRGFAGCSAETYDSDPIPLATLAIGSYVCVKTDQGRISQFRLNGYTGTTMNLGYTTWAN